MTVGGVVTSTDPTPRETSASPSCCAEPRVWVTEDRAEGVEAPVESVELELPTPKKTTITACALITGGEAVNSGRPAEAAS